MNTAAATRGRPGSAVMMTDTATTTAVSTVLTRPLGVAGHSYDVAGPPRAHAGLYVVQRIPGAPGSLSEDRAPDQPHSAMVALARFGQVTDVVDQVQPLILLAAISSVLSQELEREEHQHLASDRLKADLHAFTGRVEDELDGLVARRRLRLAEDCSSGGSDD